MSEFGHTRQLVENIQLSKTVGTYSLGNLLVVYEIKRHVLAQCQTDGQRNVKPGNALADRTIANDHTLDSLHPAAPIGNQGMAIVVDERSGRNKGEGQRQHAA